MTPFAWGMLAAVGCVSGLSAGLLGIGGGLIVVPSLIYGLPLLGIAGPDVPKIATATSLALVIPTALASAQAHAAKGAVCLKSAALLAPGIIAGSFLAGTLAPVLNFAHHCRGLRNLLNCLHLGASPLAKAEQN